MICELNFLLLVNFQIPRPMPPAGLPSAAAQASNQDELAVAVMTGLASLTSRTSIGLTLVIGIVSSN